MPLLIGHLLIKDVDLFGDRLVAAVVNDDYDNERLNMSAEMSSEDLLTEDINGIDDDI